MLVQRIVSLVLLLTGIADFLVRETRIPSPSHLAETVTVAHQGTLVTEMSQLYFHRSRFLLYSPSESLLTDVDFLPTNLDFDLFPQFSYPSSQRIQGDPGKISWLLRSVPVSTYILAST